MKNKLWWKLIHLIGNHKKPYFLSRSQDLLGTAKSRDTAMNLTARNFREGKFMPLKSQFPYWKELVWLCAVMILQIPLIFVILGHFSLPEKAVGLSFVHGCLWGPAEISFLKCLSGSLRPQWAAESLGCEKQSKVEKADVCKSPFTNACDHWTQFLSETETEDVSAGWALQENKMQVCRFGALSKWRLQQNL